MISGNLCGYMFIPRGVELVRLVDTPGGNIIHVVYSIYSVVGMLRRCVPEP